MGAIIGFFQFIIDMVMTLIELVQMGVSTLTTVFSFLPPVITTSAVVLITVCVIYKILGRENQS